MPTVDIYTTRSCPYCRIAKALLQRKGTVPQIFIGPLHLGGTEELRALERAGQLDALLAGEGATA